MQVYADQPGETSPAVSHRPAGDLASMRVPYLRGRLSEADMAPDPLTQLSRWLSDAAAAGVREPNAIVLATASAQGRPSTRHVLLKGMDSLGLVFYTNRQSRKARELAENPYASACFPWSDHERQVVVSGTVHEVDRQTAAQYWRSRPRESQLGAWASDQSQVVAGGRAALEQALRDVQARFPGEVPLPGFWGGWRIVPETYEFWQGGPGRLHDRLRYHRDADEHAAAWIIQRLAP